MDIKQKNYILDKLIELKRIILIVEEYDKSIKDNTIAIYRVKDNYHTYKLQEIQELINGIVSGNIENYNDLENANIIYDDYVKYASRWKIPK